MNFSLNTDVVSQFLKFGLSINSRSEIKSKAISSVIISLNIAETSSSKNTFLGTSLIRIEFS